MQTSTPFRPQPRPQASRPAPALLRGARPWAPAAWARGAWVSAAVVLATGCASGSAPGGGVNPGLLPLEALPAAETWEVLEAGGAGGPVVEPQVINRPEVERALAQHYDPELRRRGIEGSVQVQVFVDPEGWVRHARVDQGSGQEELDRAAQAVALVFRFSPAQVAGEPVPVWLTIPIGFETR